MTTRKPGGKGQAETLSAQLSRPTAAAEGRACDRAPPTRKATHERAISEAEAASLLERAHKRRRSLPLQRLRLMAVALSTIRDVHQHRAEILAPKLDCATSRRRPAKLDASVSDAALLLRERLRELIEPYGLALGDRRLVWTWADGSTVGPPPDPRLLALAEALDAALPALDPQQSEKPLEQLPARADARTMRDLYRCYVQATGQGTATKYGPAVRFVAEALRFFDGRERELGAIEQTLRRYPLSRST